MERGEGSGGKEGERRKKVRHKSSVVLHALFSLTFTCVLAGAVHGSHPCTQLTTGALLHSIEDEISQRHLMEALQRVSIHFIIQQHLVCRKMSACHEKMLASFPAQLSVIFVRTRGEPGNKAKKML